MKRTLGNSAAGQVDLAAIQQLGVFQHGDSAGIEPVAVDIHQFIIIGRFAAFRRFAGGGDRCGFCRWREGWSERNRWGCGHRRLRRHERDGGFAQRSDHCGSGLGAPAQQHRQN
ncbi:MAG TPA: hypothetical protein DCP32_10130 [Anaerolineaceae bacterium]|nr:hypothetical protein [Anaerolineaceae bacterium]